LHDVLELAKSVQADAQRLCLRPMSVGIGICELVDADGQILSDTTIRWAEIPAHIKLEQATRLDVFFDADVRAAARAEAHFGAARELGCFLYITVGTGISSCMVLNMAPFTGARGLTGTFASEGLLIPGADGELFTSLPLENFASGPALAAR